MRKGIICVFSRFLIGLFLFQSFFISGTARAAEDEREDITSADSQAAVVYDNLSSDEIAAKATTAGAIEFSHITKSDAQTVSLVWGAADNVEGYNLYRKSGVETDYEKVNSELIAETHFEDDVATGQDYLYVLEAVIADKTTFYTLCHIVCDENGQLHEVMAEDDFEDGSFSEDFWTVASGNWEVADGTFNHLDSATEGIICAGDGAWTDYTVEMAFYTGNGGGYPGLAGRYQDEDNYYYFQMQKLSKLAFTIKEDGSSSGETVSYSMSRNTWYTLRMVFEGDSIKCYIIDDGKTHLIYEETDTTFSAGKVGVRNKWQTVQLDDLYVYQPLLWKNDGSVTADNITDTAVDLSWNEVDGAEIYQLFRSFGDDITCIYEGETASYTDEGLTTGTTYQYYMTYTRDDEISEKTAAVEITTELVAPDTPTGVVSYIFENAIRLIWDVNSGADGYIIYRREKGWELPEWDWHDWDAGWHGSNDSWEDGENRLKEHWNSDSCETKWPDFPDFPWIVWEEVYNGTDADYLDLELDEATAYEYKIVAYNEAGTSEPTETITLTTKASDVKTVCLYDLMTVSPGGYIHIAGDSDLDYVNIKVYNASTEELIYISSVRPWGGYIFSASFRLPDTADTGTYVVVAGSSRYSTAATFEVEDWSGDNNHGHGGYGYDK